MQVEFLVTKETTWDDKYHAAVFQRTAKYDEQGVVRAEDLKERIAGWNRHARLWRDNPKIVFVEKDPISHSNFYVGVALLAPSDPPTIDEPTRERVLDQAQKKKKKEEARRAEEGGC